VPEILELNPCAKLALEAEVRSRFGFLRRVAVFAVCAAKIEEISDPRTCREGCEHFERL
jgi:hypothetical protein